MDLSRIDKIRINFIVGPGRSGTTLLVWVINEHKNCIASPEIKHLLFFYEKYKDVKVVTATLIEDYKNHLKLFAENKRFLFGPTNREINLFDELEIGQAINYGQLSKLVYLCLMDGKTDPDVINCIVDKNPYYTFYIDRIFQLFPDARVIGMVRDYRGYILSNRQSQKPYVKTHSVFYYANVWNLYINRLLAAKKDYPGKVEIIRYEDLAANKEETVERLLVHFGITYSPALFEFHNSIRTKFEHLPLTTAQHERAKKKLKDLRSPINPGRVHSWQQQLTKREIRKADTICGANAVFLGYSPAAAVSALEKLWFRIASLPAYIRTSAFSLLDSPEMHYRIYMRQVKKARNYQQKEQ